MALGKVTVWLGFLGLILGACQSPDPQPDTVTQRFLFRKGLGVSADRSNKFLDKLELVPEGNRLEYLAKYPDEVRALALSDNPAVLGRFENLVHQYRTPHRQDSSRSKSFLDKLESMPEKDRLSYMDKNPEEASEVISSNDPAVIARFGKLLRQN